MPINCPSGEKARYRVRKTGKGKAQRLAFCGDRVVESTKMKKNKAGKLKKSGKPKKVKR